MEIWEIWQIMGIMVLDAGDEEILYEQVESINIHVVNEMLRKMVREDEIRHR